MLTIARKWNDTADLKEFPILSPPPPSTSIWTLKIMLKNCILLIERIIERILKPSRKISLKLSALKPNTQLLTTDR